MADLFIDGEALARTRARLRSIEDLLNRPCREMAALPSEAVAQDVLQTRLHEFGDEWAYGIRKLGEFSAAAGQALTQVDRAFQQADQELSSGLEQSSRGGSDGRS